VQEIEAHPHGEKPQRALDSAGVEPGEEAEAEDDEAEG